MFGCPGPGQSRPQLPRGQELVPEPTRNVCVEYFELLFYKGIKCFLWNRRSALPNLHRCEDPFGN